MRAALRYLLASFTWAAFFYFFALAFPTMSRGSALLGAGAFFVFTALLLWPEISKTFFRLPRPVVEGERQPLPERFLAAGLLITPLVILFIAAQGWFSGPFVAEKLPGFSWFGVLSVDGTPLARKQYVFEFGTPEGPKTAFYLSASERFVFEITDIHGSSYQLDVPLGQNGIPIGQWIVLICEVGSGSNYAYMRAVVNGTTVQVRKFDFPIDFGTLRWKGQVGSDLNGQNRAGFLFEKLGIANPITLNDSAVSALTENERKHYGF